MNPLMKSMYLERKKDDIKSKLLEIGYYKTPEGRQLYELTLSELQKIYKKQLVKGRK
ncbi:Fur-regulated basic protein FbpA [Bacillus capparidis]|uniref:Fur-regulated basic protein FbpA n=1 Tax=Bacillus capparidis TaxID=1840411 RepID=A0ABS4D1K9_9BACI|nr:Fur-regulated basic protein FbpA [Bacillus capparidis]MBP1083487.1 hypothetical protein [Bacillus capparidis]MED1094688.1 Fur-regulated basic protein FbpA [Bacillus capparidis]